jgi:hypothetical protein
MNITRRAMLQTASFGLGQVALATLLGEQARAARPGGNPVADDLAARKPPLPARAKRVVFLCMSGGPAHLDTFDYKPQTGKKPHAGSVYPFRQRGQSGLWISDLLPETARQADQLCLLNGMYADTGIHAQSFLQLHTGERLRERPSLGSWVSYGLGTENQNLPAFISLNTSKTSVYSSAFLPSIHTGTPIGVNGEEMSKATINNVVGEHLPQAAKRRQLDFVQTLNRRHMADRPSDDRLDSVIRSMELGYQMQSEAPGLLDLTRETQATLDRYRVGRGKTVGVAKESDFGRQCLLARRFLEAGVRFVEVNHGSWDQHKNHRRDLEANCEATDAPIAALLDDLKRRGMLDDTLVVWGGEFGRPGLVPNDGKDESGHNHRGFTFWVAGGGVKPGFTYGRTNETGAQAVDGKMHFRDLHATILELLGLSAAELTYRYAGRDHRLTGPEGGRVVREIFA